MSQKTDDEKALAMVQAFRPFVYNPIPDIGDDKQHIAELKGALIMAQDKIADLLKGAEALHTAADMLLVLIIEECSKNGRTFYPSQTNIWPHIQVGYNAIQNAKRK